MSQDEALSQRLNQLVTTGDDSPAAPALAAGLRELKNKCQYNKSGLLPQARLALAGCREAPGPGHSGSPGRRTERTRPGAGRQRAALKAHQEALERQENRQKLERVEEARQKEKTALMELERARVQSARASQSGPWRRAAAGPMAGLREALRLWSWRAPWNRRSHRSPPAPPAPGGPDGPAAREESAASWRRCPRLENRLPELRAFFWPAWALLWQG